MNFKQADVILKKINRLYETMALDNKVDVFEQDLMLSYIRQLREAFTAAKTTRGTSKPGAPLTPKIPETKTGIKKAAETRAEKPASLSSFQKQPKRRSWAFPGTSIPESIAKKPAPLPVVNKPAAEVKKAPKPVPKTPARKPEAKKTPKPVPKTPARKPEAKKAPKPVAQKSKPSAEKKVAPPRVKAGKKPAPRPRIKASKPATTKPAKSTGSLSRSNYEALFEHRDAIELSEMQKKMPIKDLTKAMSSREKTSIINELFGGNSKAFDEAIKILNRFNSFGQAKAYLSDKIAAKYGWPEKSKKETSSDFIELLRRRYK